MHGLVLVWMPTMPASRWQPPINYDYYHVRYTLGLHASSAQMKVDHTWYACVTRYKFKE